MLVGDDDDDAERTDGRMDGWMEFPGACIYIYVCVWLSTQVDEECPECGHYELEFYTLQLRSADEGQTIFYSCEKCGHKFSVNS